MRRDYARITTLPDGSALVTAWTDDDDPDTDPSGDHSDVVYLKVVPVASEGIHCWTTPLTRFEVTGTNTYT